MPNPATAAATAPPPTAAAPPDRTRAWLERETRLALATRTLRAQLADPDAWSDRHGRRHAVEEMSSEEAAVVVRVLRRRARGLHRGAVTCSPPTPTANTPKRSSTPPTSSSPTPTRRRG